jgi:hypothetical protein
MANIVSVLIATHIEGAKKEDKEDFEKNYEILWTDGLCPSVNRSHSFEKLTWSVSCVQDM